MRSGGQVNRQLGASPGEAELTGFEDQMGSQNVLY